MNNDGRARQDPDQPDDRAPTSPPLGSYESMPDLSSGPVRPATQVDRPRSILMAVKLMYVGAALSLVGLVASLFLKDQIRETLTVALKKQGKTANAATMDQYVQTSVILSVVLGVVGVILFLWLAKANGEGRSWARVVATVLAALKVVGTALGLGGSAMPLAILNIMGALVAIAIVVLLWRKEATAYFRAHSAPRG